MTKQQKIEAYWKRKEQWREAKRAEQEAIKAERAEKLKAYRERKAYHVIAKLVEDFENDVPRTYNRERSLAIARECGIIADEDKPWDMPGTYTWTEPNGDKITVNKETGMIVAGFGTGHHKSELGKLYEQRSQEAATLKEKYSKILHADRELSDKTVENAIRLANPDVFDNVEGIYVYKSDDGDIVTQLCGADGLTVELIDDRIGIEIEHIKIPESQRGVGIKWFSGFVDAAKETSHEQITLLAYRSENYNGYYTWPRYGFDQILTEAIQSEKRLNAIRSGFPNAKKVSDLMATQEGRDLWRAIGVSTNMWFDLSDNSNSMKELEAYKKERGL